jgi:ribokinase
MGAPVALVACVGDDPAGRAALQALQEDAIDTSRCRIVSEPTGRAAVLVDHDGRNAISVGPGANALLVREDLAGPWPQQTRLLLTQLEIPAAAASAAISLARSRGVMTCLNATPADRFHSLTESPDMLVVNRTEAEALGGGSGSAGQLAKALSMRLGINTVVVTDSDRGAALQSGAELIVEEAHPVTVRDSTGAGDAFAGVFAASLAEGVTVRVALHRACVAGALACTISGASPAIPSRRQVLAAAAN